MKDVDVDGYVNKMETKWEWDGYNYETEWQSKEK